MSLRLLYGIELNFKLEKLCELAGLVQESANFRFQPNKPIVGERAFTREAGISVAGWMRYHLGSEAFLPELVGNVHGVVLGKKSGRHSIQWKLKQMGLEASEEQVARILEMVKRESERKKGEINDEEFKHIVKMVLS